VKKEGCVGLAGLGTALDLGYCGSMGCKPWYSQFGGRGPDWVIDLVVSPLCVGRLRQVVEGLSLDGFQRQDAQGRQGAIIDDQGDHLWFIDNHNAPTFAARLEGRAAGDGWVFHFIAVEGNVLRIERGHGGYDCDDPGLATTTEHQVLEAVLVETGIGLVRWAGYAGGDGHEAQDVASGHTKEQLRRFLT